IAPFPGKILSVLVTPGTVVQAGQPLMILEAMKMENEIQSPRACTIVSVDVAVGQMVDSNQQLCVIQ
ncbi:MAG: acetyl-CoA carboxylase biotin carboxyl carrier protein subunit, partial [Oscillibacter sp.]|nr:acetyl-CoA carboxylase biotin carboxyl carrier protein subunit [Oscillibacter sp.]